MVEEGGYERVVPQDKIMMHPGPGPDGGPLESNGIKGEYSILRWTAPAAGLYNISALFEGLDYAASVELPVTTDVHVRVNGASQFSGIVNGYIGGAPDYPVDPIGPAPTQSWHQVLSLTAGDIVDFAVGDGENDSYQVDSTGVTAIISTFEGGLLGDFNGDSSVDAADYSVWRDNLGGDNSLGGNGDENGASAGLVDDADHALWKANFGSTTAGIGVGSGEVPEPTTTMLIAWLSFALVACPARLRDVRSLRIDRIFG